MENFHFNVSRHVIRRVECNYVSLKRISKQICATVRPYNYIRVYFTLISISIITIHVARSANNVIIFAAVFGNALVNARLYVCVIKQFSHHVDQRRDIVMRSLVSLTYVTYVTQHHYRETQSLHVDTYLLYTRINDRPIDYQITILTPD